ncbi:MAG: PRD domain-containing protein [Streptococcaceae bacterium]|nr:PRD domain-containing protein [Streptococcaceae bacterium]
MKIQKVFNNNALLVMDEDGNEKFVMGKGIGFNRNRGSDIDSSLIEKEFILQKNAKNEPLLEIYEKLPPEEIDLVNNLIRKAEENFHQVYGLSLYVSLADHIHYVIERTREGLVIKNPLVWEVRRFYQKEFQLSEGFIKQVKKVLDVELNQDEAASIALHFVNANQEQGLLSNTFEITKITEAILRIVRYHFKREFDENTISFQRFVTHIEYLSHRIAIGYGHKKPVLDDSFLHEQVVKKYPESGACVVKIVEYLRESRNFELGLEESAYLIIHVQRLISE